MANAALHIIKIGGNVIDDDKELDTFLRSFSAIPGAKILVHGGGKIASELGKKLGIEPRMVDGRRITDAETLKLVTMVYAGLINKNIVAKLQSYGCQAIGLTGADANIVPATKRPVKDIDYGFVGDVEAEKVNEAALAAFLSNGLYPVLAPLTHDGQGNMLNTNADTIASVVALALANRYDVSLVYCFEKVGVMRDIRDENSLVERIGSSEYQAYKSSGLISEGMIPKLDNAFDALASGVKSVHIVHAHAIGALAQNEKPKGTELYA